VARKSEKAEPEKRRRGRPPARETGAHKEEWGDARLIKRYGNRRYYDASLSRAVTLAEVAEFVRQGEDVRLIDAESGGDITKRVLTQIILEEQNRSRLELMPLDFLRKMISLHDDALTTWLQQYLAAGAQWLERQQAHPSARAVQESIAAFFPWLKSLASASGEARKPAPPEPYAPTPEEWRDAPAKAEEEWRIREEIAELQRRLAHLARDVKRK
jgi:polyhydroxyalkanoate synthesis repressor PhaR